MDNDGYDLTGISEELFLLITNFHAEHPGQPLTLTSAQVAELAGCAFPECRPRLFFA